MKVTISIDLDESMKQEICDEFLNKLHGFTEEELEALEKSFMENIQEGFMDAVFEVETDAEEKEVTGLYLIGER